MSAERTGLERARKTRKEPEGPKLEEGRQTALRPSEERRRRRLLAVTFSDEGMPQRLRALAKRWGLTGPDGKRPNVSAVVEHLLRSQVEAAEAGEIDPPKQSEEGV